MNFKYGYDPESDDHYTVILVLKAHNWKARKLPIFSTSEPLKILRCSTGINRNFHGLKNIDSRFVNLFLGKEFLKDEILDPWVKPNNNNNKKKKKNLNISQERAIEHAITFIREPRDVGQTSVIRKLIAQLVEYFQTVPLFCVETSNIPIDNIKVKPGNVKHIASKVRARGWKVTNNNERKLLEIIEKIASSTFISHNKRDCWWLLLESKTMIPLRLPGVKKVVYPRIQDVFAREDNEDLSHNQFSDNGYPELNASEDYHSIFIDVAKVQNTKFQHIERYEYIWVVEVLHKLIIEKKDRGISSQIVIFKDRLINPEGLNNSR
ncbi:hypothetical protein LQ764DRAFT_211430 [Zygosaccharomyces rouxii]|nr:hypothetical protein LQ764DRAFT_211430 [Zygosaccharomyces rouxii]